MALYEKQPRARGWRYTAASGNLIVLVDQLSARSAGLYGWVEVRHAGSEEAGRAPVVFGQFNLMGANTVSTILRRWNEAHRDDDGVGAMDTVVTEIVYDVIRTFQEGPDPVDLRTVESPGHRWLQEPFLEQTAHSRLIAAGGSGKSYLALALSAQIATGVRFIPRSNLPILTGPVAYLDWEADQETHSERLRQILAGRNLTIADLPHPIHYFNMKGGGPLYRQSTGMANRLDDLGVVASVCDSVMLARGSSGEGSAEDSTVRLFEALDELGVPSLLIDHKSKAVLKSKNKEGGYGSVVMTNSVRNEWDVVDVLTPHPGNRIRLKLRHTKQNNTKRYPDLIYELAFHSDEHGLTEAVELERLEHFMQTPDVDGATVADQIVYLLAGSDEAMSAQEIAQILDKSESQIRNTLNSGEKRRLFSRAGNGRPVMWTLGNSAPHLELPPSDDDGDKPDPY